MLKKPIENYNSEIEKIEDKIIDIIVLISQISNKLTIIIESIHKSQATTYVVDKTNESR
jgi:archaellum component FlaC